MSKWLLYLLLFALAGFIREYFFVNYNILLYYVYYPNMEPTHLSDFLKSFEQVPYATLYYLKYPFTLLWTLLFFLITHFAIKHLTGQPFLLRVNKLAYLLVLTLAGLSMLYGWLVNQRLDQDEYTLSRWLMGIAQSPIICLILLASEKLIQKQSTL